MRASGLIGYVGKIQMDRNGMFCWGKALEPISKCLSCSHSGC